MVARRYEELHRSGAVSAPDLTPERLKMACLPQGAEPIENPVGAAPAVLLALEGTCVVCLPGVPREPRQSLPARCSRCWPGSSGPASPWSAK